MIFIHPYFCDHVFYIICISTRAGVPAYTLFVAESCIYKIKFSPGATFPIPFEIVGLKFILRH